MNDLFNALTGNKGFVPYPYQQSVAEYLFKGKNVILCAPTGAGKTWAAVLPFLASWKSEQQFADRLIYVLPLRSLASSLYNEIRVSCENAFFDEVSEYKIRLQERPSVTIQTGDQKDDPFFEGDIIFTTVDQCLSSYLNMPVSLPQKVANINAGAFIGSLIVFDEFHLLESDKAQKTAIEMLIRLNPFSRFIIMTATLSTKSMDYLKSLLNAEVIQLTQQEVVKIQSHSHKQRTYRWVNEPLTVENILFYHQGKRSIVIVNTVSKAQEIFLELQNSITDKTTCLLLLHSRFFSEDRKNIEEELNDYFGKDATSTNAILVTTQVVEAGIDISADNLHTELAPMNSLIQRAGRCARYSGKRGFGTVWVYELDKNDNGQFKLGPYRNAELGAIVEATRQVFNKLPENGKIFDFAKELDCIDQVHTDQELVTFSNYRRKEYELKKLILQAMDGENPTATRKLIRDVASVNIIITDKPEKLRFNQSRWPQMLSIPRTSLYSLKRFFSSFIDDAWVAKIPLEIQNKGNENEEGFSFEWIDIPDIDYLLKQASWLVVVHPKFASYSSESGLQLGIDGSIQEPQYVDIPLIPRYSTTYETYNVHVQNVIEECRKMHSSYRIGAKRLVELYNLTIDKIETLSELACALHDVGKLSKKWQNAIRQWQEHKDKTKLTDEPVGHSDYDPEIDWQIQRKFPKRPPHAVEGAFSIAQCLCDEFGADIAAVIYTAIARHHGAFTNTLKTFELINDANKWIDKSLPFNILYKCSTKNKPDYVECNEFTDCLLKFQRDEDETLWPLYSFIVRRLRLADQKSQKEVNQ